MGELRELLTDAGYDDVRTYLQSGNVVLSTRRSAKRAAADCERLIKERFGLEIAVVARTAAEIAAVVKRNPLGDVATEPKRYQVSFLESAPARDVVKRVEELAAPDERLAVHGREIYAWHPAGVARSKLWNALAGPKLGVTATARNWTTVEHLHEMASG
jgi:uncharacterized protein (DUF1697 family)